MQCRALAATSSLNKLFLQKAVPVQAARFSTHRFTTTAMAGATGHKNVLGGELKASGDSVGFYRNGYCMVGPEDGGNHSVSAIVTDDFLSYTKSQGNDLSTPRPGFPGLKPGDRYAFWPACLLT